MHRYMSAVLLILFAAMALVYCGAPVLSAESSKPNLIVIMVDDMGYAGLSCFGNPYFKTPELDQLAAEGLRLTDFHSSGTVCSPTRAGLVTGRYQQRSGIEAVIVSAEDHPEHRKGLQLSETTFAEALNNAGYTTGLVGKWHLGYVSNSVDYHPQNHGFDEFIGYHSGNIDYISHIGSHLMHDWWHGKTNTPEKGYSTHLINKHAENYIRQHANKSQPFCLYIAHEAIHNPVQVPGDVVRRTTKGWNRWRWQNVSQKERITKYKGMTLPVDEGIGQLRKTLHELGIAENTFVLFFSDNGPAGDFPSGSPKLRGGKGSVYEGGHKVPAIAWWPGKIKPNSVSDEPLISIDVMPTLLSLAGVKSPARKLDGVDFSPVILRQESLKPRPLFWASLGNNGRRSEAMRADHWKLVVQHPGAQPGSFENTKLELFNLAEDPSEKTNIADQHPERTQQMLKQLKEWYADTQKTATEQTGGWQATRSETETSSQAKLVIESITKETLRRNRDGSGTTWFHPRACLLPAVKAGDTPQMLMNLQPIGGSDYFGPVHWSISQDFGKTWSDPISIAAFKRDPVKGHPGLKAAVCDVTPQYHPQTGTVLALGHVVFYRGPRFARGDQLARYPLYAVRGKDGTWSERKKLVWDDPRGLNIYSNNCGQRVVMPNGDIMMSFTFGPKPTNRMVAGVHCSFDGEELKIIKVGPPLESNQGRGLLEPSLTRFRNRYYLTIRAEDGHGYVAVSDDGLNYEEKTAWAWDDGSPISMSTTQQHWLTHSDGLYLVYTRKDKSNSKVIRWRSPLWVAQVDTEKLCLIRQTERVVLPLVGDGISKPDDVALMGNFDVTNVSEHESIVTVGEWLPRRGAKGDLLLGRIKWSKPNQLVVDH